MKKLKPLFSIMMLAVLMVSTLGFSVSRHYCMGHLVEEEIFAFDDDCCEETDDHCGDSEDHHEKDCCNDEVVIIEGLEIVAAQPKSLEVDFSQSWDFQPFMELNSGESPKPALYFQTHFQRYSLVEQYSLSGRGILLRDQRFLI